jgi:hypothetical protein
MLRGNDMVTAPGMRRQSGSFSVEANSLAFWRDEAKLGILSPEKRIRFYLSLVASIGYVAAFITTASRISDAMQTDYILIAATIGMLLLPAYAIAELVSSGGAAGSKLMVLKSERTIVECFVEERLHFRAMQGTSFCAWKIGVRNLTPVIAKSLNLKIDCAEAVNPTDHLQSDCARELNEMKLVTTHSSGVPGSPMDELVTTRSFDFAETGNDIPIDRVRIFHNTADPNMPDRIFRSIGLLPIGQYHIRLCLECRNADPKYYSLQLKHTRGDVVSLIWEGECGPTL